MWVLTVVGIFFCIEMLTHVACIVALFASCALPRPPKPARAPEDEGLLAGEAETAALGPKLV